MVQSYICIYDIIILIIIIIKFWLSEEVSPLCVYMYIYVCLYMNIHTEFGQLKNVIMKREAHRIQLYMDYINILIIMY